MLVISQALMADFANSRSSPVLAVESLPVCRSGGAQSAQSKSTPTPRAYCSRDKMTDYSRLSRFGMTFGLLTASRGEELLMWFLAGFPARTLVQQDAALGSQAKRADYGPNSLASFAKYDRSTSSWKTRQYSLLEDSEQFSETWPQWGLMRGGACWELPMSVHRISGSGSGFWQTPTADDSVNRTHGKINSRGEPKLSAQVKMWPTPTKSDGIGGPGAQGWKGGENLRTNVCGSLNPDWVEWLMGWPIGWTSLDSLPAMRVDPWTAEPADIPRTTKKTKARAHRLKALGNGQVPQCAAYAFALLQGADK